jgi:glycolate oxidase iron-sulfur subunit
VAVAPCGSPGKVRARRSIRSMDERVPMLGADLPEGARFVTPVGDAETSAWDLSRAAPATADLSTCVACGLCLPHCPTYRLTGAETASPRGRIAAMRSVAAGAPAEGSFVRFMDECLVCRACEDVCPSHVPFGRMMEAAREQIEPTRSHLARLAHWLGFHWLLPHPFLIRLATMVQPFVRPLLPARVRSMVPTTARPFARLPRETEPPWGVTERGTVALLAGCVQDRWFHEVNLATIRVLAQAGWRVRVPKGQACCGALAAHNGRLGVARRLAIRAKHAFAGADVVVVNAAGCGAHMQTYDELEPGAGLPVRDVLAFLHEQGLGDVRLGPVHATVAYHDACHALRAQKIHAGPRALLRLIPELDVVEIANGDRCCGAAGMYAATQPEMATALGHEKADAIAATTATLVASANPGCSVQIAHHLGARGTEIAIVHPVQLLDRALAQPRTNRVASSTSDPK